MVVEPIERSNEGLSKYGIFKVIGIDFQKNIARAKSLVKWTLFFQTEMFLFVKKTWLFLFQTLLVLLTTKRRSKNFSNITKLTRFFVKILALFKTNLKVHELFDDIYYRQMYFQTRKLILLTNSTILYSKKTLLEKK